MYQAVSGRLARATRSAIYLFLFLSVLLVGAVGRAQNADDEKKINDTISKLTLEEKIQMLSGSTMMASTGHSTAWEFRPFA